MPVARNPSDLSNLHSTLRRNRHSVISANRANRDHEVTLRKEKKNHTSVLFDAVDIWRTYASFSTKVPHPGPRGGPLVAFERERAFCLKLASSARKRLYSHLFKCKCASLSLVVHSYQNLLSFCRLLFPRSREVDVWIRTCTTRN